MQYESPFAVVQAWQEAANAQKTDRVIELSDPNVELAGPRGSGYGHQLLRDWLGRAGLTLTTLRSFARGNDVVAAQHGVWRSAETGEATGEAHVATHFRVEDGRVVRIARYYSLDIALAEAGLTAADEIVQH